MSEFCCENGRMIISLSLPSFGSYILFTGETSRILTLLKYSEFPFNVITYFYGMRLWYQIPEHEVSLPCLLHKVCDIRAKLTNK